MTENKTNLMILATELQVIDDEPLTFFEAINSPMKEQWKEAINSELNSLEENKTWSEVTLPKGKNAIKTKWLFKIKKDSNNNPVRYKACKI